MQTIRSRLAALAAPLLRLFPRRPETLRYRGVTYRVAPRGVRSAHSWFLLRRGAVAWRVTATTGSIPRRNLPRWSPRWLGATLIGAEPEPMFGARPCRAVVVRAGKPVQCGRVPYLLAVREDPGEWARATRGHPAFREQGELHLVQCPGCGTACGYGPSPLRALQRWNEWVRNPPPSDLPVDLPAGEGT